MKIFENTKLIEMAYDNDNNYRPGDCILKMYDFYTNHEPTIKPFCFTNVVRVVINNETLMIQYRSNNGKLYTEVFDMFYINNIRIGYYGDSQASLMGLNPEDKYYEYESTSYVMNYKIIYEDPEDKSVYRDTANGIEKLFIHIPIIL